ncbi:hypothetical protein COFA105466_09635 [Corynebacterium falsenii]
MLKQCIERPFVITALPEISMSDTPRVEPFNQPMQAGGADDDVQRVFHQDALPLQRQDHHVDTHTLVGGIEAAELVAIDHPLSLTDVSEFGVETDDMRALSSAHRPDRGEVSERRDRGPGGVARWLSFQASQSALP